MDNKVKVLFLCKGVPAPGQIAEGFLNAEAGDRFVGVSAATSSVILDPLAEKVMEEVGIDISGEKSKTIPEVFRERFPYVVGIYDEAKERAPIFPFTYKIVKWSLKEPFALEGSREEQIGAFRRIRDKIKENVQKFLKDALEDSNHGLASLRAGR